MVTRRAKPVVDYIRDTAHADQTMREIAEIKRHLALIEGGMNESIDLTKRKAAAASAPLLNRMASLESALGSFALHHKEELFTGRRSLELTFGGFGFRKSTKLTLTAKNTWAAVLMRLREFGLTEGIRVKEEVNKDELLKWTPERLATLGVKRDEVDAFYYEIKAEDVEATK